MGPFFIDLAWPLGPNFFEFLFFSPLTLGHFLATWKKLGGCSFYKCLIFVLKKRVFCWYFGHFSVGSYRVINKEWHKVSLRGRHIIYILTHKKHTVRMRNAGHLTQHKRKSAVTLGSSTGGARSAVPPPPSRPRPGAWCDAVSASVGRRPSCGANSSTMAFSSSARVSGIRSVAPEMLVTRGQAGQSRTVGWPLASDAGPSERAVDRRTPTWGNLWLRVWRAPARRPAQTCTLSWLPVLGRTDTLPSSASLGLCHRRRVPRTSR